MKKSLFVKLPEDCVDNYDWKKKREGSAAQS